ncbi:MAG: hypothetical protein AMXMBFR82_47570 [Candidatus Hydrogenedentota bacterium]
MANEPAIRIEYDLDADDRIAAIRGDWYSFAVANGAPGLTTDSVIGHVLWSFVDGLDVRSVYRMLVENVRSTGRSNRLSFNCDDRENVRRFDLNIHLGDKGTVQFESTLIETTRRPPVPLFEPAIARSDDAILTVCSVCKLVDVQGVWLAVEEALARLNLMSNPVMPQVSHGLCPSCFETMSATLH